MARGRSPERDKAFKLYKEHKGNITNREIAQRLSVPEKNISSWKSRDKWNEQINIVLQTNQCSTTNKKRSTTKEKEAKRKTKEKQVEEVVTKVLENSELTDKQRDFCLYYVKYRNKTKAYMEAYKCSYKNACSHAFEVWKNVEVQREIDKLLHEARSEFKLDLKDMLQKHVDIAFSDIGDYLSFKRVRKNKWTKNDKGQDIPVINPDTGEQDYFEYNTVELNDSKEVDTSILQEISEGKDGVRIKLQDKMKALDFLSKHLGLLDMATKEKLDLAREKFEYEKTKLAEVEEENDGSLKEMLEGFRNEV